MYQTVVPPLQRSLTALARILSKAEAHCTDHKIVPEVLLQSRLFPDMLPLVRQIQLTCDFATRLNARLSGNAVPSHPDTETTFAGLRDRIAAVQAELANATPDAFSDAATRAVTFKAGPSDMTLSGADYHAHYALPQFYFHMTMAYAILRHNGVVLGKRDYMAAPEA
ncbi:DUF1993 domain-containing protein [Loktanella sp. M215]|uniref:DUF1993 domain-containing protein n=1 Tax=Loktanella sp. M215 TaxID=2675431 RepID=UPI001F193013|nr:DUF1993 domain-containing protein [Loktanella sp. M215]MCF7701141.1 DUF1993 family protein [Loktanella sp. M215]